MMERVYAIAVSEPWNYDGDNGENLLFGKVIKSLGERLLFESDKELNFEGKVGKFLILSARNLDKFPEDVNGVTVNGGLIINSKSDSNVSEEDIDNAQFVLIGLLEARTSSPPASQ